MHRADPGRIDVVHPGVDLQLVVNNSFLNLTQREADIAVRPSNKPPASLVGRKVYWLGRVFELRGNAMIEV